MTYSQELASARSTIESLTAELDVLRAGNQARETEAAKERREKDAREAEVCALKRSLAELEASARAQVSIYLSIYIAMYLYVCISG